MCTSVLLRNNKSTKERVGMNERRSLYLFLSSCCDDYFSFEKWFKNMYESFLNRKLFAKIYLTAFF